MKNNPIPENERERLNALKEYEILDTIAEEDFDRLVKLASIICEVPISLVSLIDEDRQWFKAKVGLDAPQTPRDISFCQHAIMGSDTFEVQDATKDDRFKDNPLVLGAPDIRFYAGYPLQDPNGYNLGTLCVIDRSPKKLNEKQSEALKLLAQEVVNQIVARKKYEEREKLEKLFNQSIDMICIAGTDGYFKKINTAFTKVLGWSEKELLSTPFVEYIHPDDIESTFKEVEKLAAGATSIDFQNRYRNKNGEYLILSWVANPDTQTGELFCITRDITNQVILQNNIKAERKAINESVIKVEFSPEKRILNANDKFLELVGYSSDEIKNIEHSNLLFEDDQVVAAYEKFWNELLNGNSQNGQFRRKTKSGKEINIQGAYIPVKDINGKVEKIIKIAYDITQSILDAKESKDLRFAIEQSSIVAITDQKGIINYANDKFCEISKYSREELLGQDHRILNSGYHPKEFMADLWKTIANGKVWKGEVKNKAKDGTFYWVDTTIVPFLNSQGKPYQYTAIRSDITSRKNYEQELTMLSLVAEKTDNAVVITDKNRNIEWVNKGYERITGYMANECMGHNPGHFLQGPDTNPQTVLDIRNALNKGESFLGEILNYGKNGDKYWLKLNITPIVNESGEVERFIAIEMDITKEKELILKIEKQNKELDQFAYVVSHDLKAPLRAITTLTEFIEEDISDKLDGDALNNFSLLKQRALRMQNIINDILDYSKIGKEKVKLEEVNPKVLLNEIYAGMPVDNQFKFILADSFPTLNIQRIFLEQISANIISNAIKYNDKEEGRLEVSYKINDRNFVLSFKDNGPGIDPTYHKKIFEIFQTLSDQKHIDSTGIGLSTVKKIAIELGGDVTIESSVGEGSTFILTLPKKYLKQ